MEKCGNLPFVFKCKLSFETPEKGGSLNERNPETAHLSDTNFMPAEYNHAPWPGFCR